MENNNQKILLVINPCAGRMQSKAGMFDIVDMFCDHGKDFMVHLTTGENDAAEYIKNNGMNYDLIVCCGGDGTLNETINGLLALPERRTLGYIPAGTTNDFATTLGLSKDIRRAAQIIFDGNKSQIDVGLFNNERYFAYIATFGLFTATSYETPQKMKNLLGHTAYVFEGVKSLADIQTYNLIVEYDNEVVEGEYIFCTISNSISIGGTYKLSEDIVSLSDGKFEMMLIEKPKNIIEIPAIIQNVLRQKYDEKHIKLIHAKKIKITSKEDITWSLDGENGGTYKYMEISNIFHAVDIITPSEEENY